MESLLIKAENIKALNFLLRDRNLKGKIDLIYIDPPYATGSNFTISNGRASTISNSKNGTLAYADKLKGNEFFDFLRERLILLRELLSEQGSIYLHIDYKIGHYVKILMDEVFGINNFRNDITRIKTNPKNFKRIGYGNIKDMILFYSKAEKPIWNEPKSTYTEKDIETLYKKINSEGRHWRTDVEIMEQWDKEGLIEWSSTGNPRKIIFADEKKGKRVQDIWEFKEPQYPSYPTEKNQNILDLIIKTSSNESSIVLDCFCGSGTTLKSAQELGRKWIGIDESEYAIEASTKKMNAVKRTLFSNANEYEFLELLESVKITQE